MPTPLREIRRLALDDTHLFGGLTAVLRPKTPFCQDDTAKAAGWEGCAQELLQNPRELARKADSLQSAAGIGSY